MEEESRGGKVDAQSVTWDLKDEQGRSQLAGIAERISLA